ncbi:enoyl-CoA hydratase [Rhodovibrionaceae bacterium A322]
MTENIKREVRDGILHLQIDRLDKKNALTQDMYSALADGLDEAAADTSIRAVLFKGGPGAFTAGNDLKDFLNRPPKSGEAPVHRFIKTIAQSPVPLIAQVEGVAVGVGTTMLLHCDMVFVAEDARLQLPFVNLALLPEAGSSYLLPKIMGHARASELLMTGRPFGGQEALDLGIATAVVAATDLEARVSAACTALAQQPPGALRKTKALLKSDLNRVMEQMDKESQGFAECLTSAECKEALNAFLEKRKPDFSQF